MARFRLLLWLLIACLPFSIHAFQTATDPSSPPAISNSKSTTESTNGADPSLPVLTDKAAPEYPDKARAACKQQTVKLSLIVDENGLPRDIRVIRPLGAGLDEKAVEAVTKWRFRPAMRGGRPVAAPTTVEINFQPLNCAHSGPMIAEATREMRMTQPPQPGSLPPKNAPLRLQVLQVHWSEKAFRANGFGHANLIDGSRKQGFDFTCSCSDAFVPNETSILYPARWKKLGTRLVIDTTEIDNPKKHSSCELKVNLRPFAYTLSDMQRLADPSH